MIAFNTAAEVMVAPTEVTAASRARILAAIKAPRAIPVSLVATSAQASPTKGASTVSRREPSRVSERRLAAKLGRALAGDGRYRVQPFPRPSEFE